MLTKVDNRARRRITEKIARPGKGALIKIRFEYLLFLRDMHQWMPDHRYAGYGRVEYQKSHQNADPGPAG